MLALAVVAAACGDNLAGDGRAADAVTAVVCEPVRGTDVTLRWIVKGCEVPEAPAPPDCIAGLLTLVTAPRGDHRLFAVEREGRIRIVAGDRLHAEPFLDLSDDLGGPVIADNELGLLGLAFHPAYADNRTFYVFYTAENPDPLDIEHPLLDVLARYRTRADDADRADPDSGEVVLAILDRFGNHNGGMIDFGPDGFLYVGTGDGGDGGDPFGNAQNPHSLLGKLLRLDVDAAAAGAPYAIPADNPYADGVAGAPEVYVRGLRNPWRWSFDRATGDLWIGDVGQAEIEELDVLRPGEIAGANLGWAMYEGNDCFAPPCDPTGMTFPQVTHDHDAGWWSIIGGEVYRGACFPDLVGTYFYTDCGYGHMMAARLAADGTVTTTQLPGDFIGGPTSLHGGGTGELYETDALGNVFQIVVATP